MLIFKEEINAGLKESLTKARVVSYCSLVEKMVITNEKIEAALKAVAAKYDWVQIKIIAKSPADKVIAIPGETTRAR
jgi:hypothetical protein